MSYNDEKERSVEIIPTYIDKDLELTILTGDKKYKVLKWINEISLPIRSKDASFFYNNVFTNIWERNYYSKEALERTRDSFHFGENSLF